MMKLKFKKMCGSLAMIIAVLMMIFALLLLQSCTAENPPSETAASTGNTESSTEGSSEAPVVTDTQLVVDGSAIYKIIRPTSCTDSVVRAVKSVYDAIIEKTGVTPAYGDDFISWQDSIDPLAYELLIGQTNRSETAELLKTTAYGDYSIKQIGNKFVIAAWDDEALADGCSAFVEYINQNATANTLVVAAGYTATGTKNEQVNALPYYSTESACKIVDLADQNYMLYMSNTNLDEYNTYLNKLADNGYTQYAKREIEENVFSTYKNDQYIINTTYTGCDNDARIIIEPTYSMTAFEKAEYTKITEPKFTMVGLECYGPVNEINQIGLFLIFTLEDGRLVVVDGGGHYNECIEIINTNLKAAAPDPNNITVAAWFFTHAHGDHTGGFIKFANSNYGKQIKVENFIYNFTTTDQYSGIDNGVGDSGRCDQCKATVAAVYPTATVIKAHTGQVYKFADAEIEMLYTFDDIQPATLTYHNTTSLTFRYETNDQTIMVLGDASTTASDRLVKMYKSYLKSDIVQISHHGYTGGTTALYRHISATVNMWPGGEKAFATLKERDYNAFALNLASVKETFVSGSSVKTIVLPYTPAA